MNDLYLIYRNLTRNKLRMFLNSTAIVIAFLLFGVLFSLKDAFEAGVELTADNRLVVLNKINFTQPLPMAHVNKIRAIEGVKAVSWANWFGAYYQDPKQQVVAFAVDPESWLEVYEETVVSDADRQRWYNERQGLLVGKRMADLRGWKVGDRVPLSSSIFSKADGSHTWDFVVSGIFSADEAQIDTNYLMLHYKYFIETQTFGSDWFGWAVLTTQDASLNEAVVKRIDDTFANSPAETKTTTEKQFNKSFIEQLGSIGLIITSVVTAAFFTILLIVGNSMALAVRERTSEIAVMKTLGFRAGRVFRLILSESILLALVGGLQGLLIAWFIVNGAKQDPSLQNLLPNLVLGGNTAFIAILYMIALGVLTGIFPAWRAMKLNTIDALNRR